MLCLISETESEQRQMTTRRRHRAANGAGAANASPREARRYNCVFIWCDVWWLQDRDRVFDCQLRSCRCTVTLRSVSV